MNLPYQLMQNDKDCFYASQVITQNCYHNTKSFVEFLSKQTIQAVEDIHAIATTYPSLKTPIDFYGYFAEITFPMGFQIAMAMRDFNYLLANEMFQWAVPRIDSRS